MAKVCEVTGSRPNVKNLVSHANNRVKSRQMPNLQWRKVYVPELGRSVDLRMTTRALRTLRKQNNVLKFLREAGIAL